MGSYLIFQNLVRIMNRTNVFAVQYFDVNISTLNLINRNCIEHNCMFIDVVWN